MNVSSLAATPGDDSLSWRRPVFIVALALPFVGPWVAGPSVNAWQWFVSMAALAVLVQVGPARAPGRPAVGLLAIAALAIAWRAEGVERWLPPIASIAAMGIAASVGAGLAASTRTDQSAFARGLLVAGLVSAVLGLCQYYGAAASLVPWTTAPEVGQAHGNLRQRNQFATLISMALAAALWLHASYATCATHGRDRPGDRQPDSLRPARWARWALGASIGLLTLAAAASTSRTGLLQWLSICTAAAALAWGERRAAGAEVGAPAPGYRLPHPLVLLALIPAYFAVAWALPLAAGPEVEGMLRRLRDGLPEGHGRMLLWRNVVELIALHPWTGWGWGELGFAHFDHLYAGERFVEILDNAHNLPLHLAVELGVPVSLAICGGSVALALSARPWRERDPTRLLAWAALGAIVSHSLLEYPLWYGPFQLVFGLCLGLLWPGSRPAAGAIAPGVSQRARGVAAALLLAAVALAAWDYVRISQIYLARADRLAPWRNDTLAKLRASRLFAGQVRFAEVSLTPVTPSNAAAMHDLALRALHFSPEPRVIAKLVESATLLGRDDEAAAFAARFKIAFPPEYARWLAGLPVEEP